jgi:hypothetical protein
MLHGMQGMSSDVRGAVSVDMLPRLLGSCKEPLEAQAVGNALWVVNLKNIESLFHFLDVSG